MSTDHAQFSDEHIVEALEEHGYPWQEYILVGERPSRRNPVTVFVGLRLRCYLWGIDMRARLLGFFLLGLVGCGASVQQLHSRAAFDLNCPQDQLQVVEIDNRTRGVRGCGRQATYVENCTDPMRSGGTCTWIMNTVEK